MDKYIKSYGSFKQYEPQKKGGFFNFFKRIKRYSHLSNKLASPSFSATTRPVFMKPAAKKNYRGKIILSLLGGVILAWIILMIYLPYFRINKINFEGLKIIELSEISEYISDKYLTGGVIPHNNYFFISEGKVEEDINSKYAIDSVTVKKVFPGLIYIKIEEKITTIIYDNEASYSLLDKDGTVIKIIEQYSQIPVETLTTMQTSSASTTIVQNDTTSTAPTIIVYHKPDYGKLSRNYADVPILLDTRRQQIDEKQTNVLTSNIISSIIDWQKTLHDEGIGDIHYFETGNPPAGLTVHLDKNWLLLIQPENSIDGQINNLKTILSNRDINPVEYIDLRFGERIFWK